MKKVNQVELELTQELPDLETVSILGMIKEESLEVLETLRNIAIINPKAPVRIMLSSPGGEEDVGYAIFDAIKAMPNKVTIEGYGQVCSIAALIFQAGDVRLLSPNCTFMMHNGQVSMPEIMEVDALQKMSAHFLVSNKRYYKAIAEETGIAIDTVRKWCNSEKFFGAKEAVKAKLADRITRRL